MDNLTERVARAIIEAILKQDDPDEEPPAVTAAIAAARPAIRAEALGEAAQCVLGSLACSICLEINDCKCAYDKAVSAGPCQPPADKLAAAIRALEGGGHGRG
jgi:hypothetical protein